MGFLKGMLSLPFLLVKGAVSLTVSVVKSPYKLYKGAQKKGYAKDFYNLQEIGVDVSDLSYYENEINNKTNEVDEINKKISNYNKEKEKVGEKLLKVEETIQKMRQKKNRISLMFSKEYHIQKKLLKIYKAQMEEYPEKISKEIVNLKSNEKDIKNAKKELKDLKKDIRKKAKKYEEVIDVMSYFNKHRNAIRRRFPSTEFSQIEAEMQQIKNNQGNWIYSNVLPKDYLKYLKGQITFDNNRQSQQGQQEKSQQEQQGQSQQEQQQKPQQEEQHTDTYYDVDLGHEEIGFLDRINNWTDRMSNSKGFKKVKKFIFGNRDNEEIITAEDIYTYHTANADKTRNTGKKFRDKYHVDIRKHGNRNNSRENDSNRTSDEQTPQVDDDELEP